LWLLSRRRDSHQRRNQNQGQQVKWAAVSNARQWVQVNNCRNFRWKIQKLSRRSFHSEGEFGPKCPAWPEEKYYAR